MDLLLCPADTRASTERTRSNKPSKSLVFDASVFEASALPAPASAPSIVRVTTPTPPQLSPVPPPRAPPLAATAVKSSLSFACSAASARAARTAATAAVTVASDASTESAMLASMLAMEVADSSWLLMCTWGGGRCGGIGSATISHVVADVAACTASGSESVAVFASDGHAAPNVGEANAAVASGGGGACGALVPSKGTKQL
mmetsp:Transcript_109150/g.307741  ORF Transcript_109150/g.307741 Transcript_109150/m.307741 type:complete len:202 (+) Transcript_109150:125-730(+)